MTLHLTPIDDVKLVTFDDIQCPKCNGKETHAHSGGFLGDKNVAEYDLQCVHCNHLWHHVIKFTAA